MTLAQIVTNALLNLECCHEHDKGDGICCRCDGMKAAFKLGVIESRARDLMEAHQAFNSEQFKQFMGNEENDLKYIETADRLGRAMDKMGEALWT